MFPESEWENTRESARTRLTIAGTSLLRATLMFGFAMIALTLVLVPVAENQVRTMVAQNSAFGIDTTTTGSVRRGGNTRTYTIHRSILQSSPDAICIISQDGTSRGDC